MRHGCFRDSRREHMSKDVAALEDRIFKSFDIDTNYTDLVTDIESDACNRNVTCWSSGKIQEDVILALSKTLNEESYE